MTDSQQPEDSEQQDQPHADPASGAPDSDWSTNPGTGPGLVRLGRRRRSRRHEPLLRS